MTWNDMETEDGKKIHGAWELAKLSLLDLQIGSKIDADQTWKQRCA